MQDLFACEFLDEEDVFKHRQVLKQIEKLEDVADVVPTKRGHFFRVVSRNIFTKETVGASRWAVQSRETVEQGGFSRTRRAEQDDPFSFVNFKTHTVQGFDYASRSFVMSLDVVHAEKCV